MFVARPDQSLSNGRVAFANRERFPVLRLGLCHQPIELVLSFKNRAKWQSRLVRQPHRANQQDGNENVPNPHDASNSTRNSASINDECQTTNDERMTNV